MQTGFIAEKYLGREVITGLSAVKGLTVPPGTVLALVTPLTQGVYWSFEPADNAAALTASGYPAPVGVELRITCQHSLVRFAEMAASASLRVVYFG